MKIQNTLVYNIRGRSQRYFAHVTTVSLSWRVQNIVVIGRVYLKLKRFEFSSNFEFDRNMLSGTGAWWADRDRRLWNAIGRSGSQDRIWADCERIVSGIGPKCGIKVYTMFVVENGCYVIWRTWWCRAGTKLPGMNTSSSMIAGWPRPGARPTKHISIEFEIRWKFKTL